jgi:hypothetical protein
LGGSWRRRCARVAGTKPRCTKRSRASRSCERGEIEVRSSSNIIGSDIIRGRRRV